MTLHSKTIGKVLRVILWVTLGLIGISLVNILLTRFGVNGSGFIKFDQFNYILLFGVIYVSYLLYLIWVYKVHKDLKQMNEDYSITPWGAIGRVLIPFYNLYGLWNIYSTMSKKFKEQRDSFKWGEKLSLFLPFYYILLLATRTVDRYISRTPSIEISELVWFLSFVGEFILVVFFILMLNTVSNALQTLAEQNPDSHSRSAEDKIASASTL